MSFAKTTHFPSVALPDIKWLSKPVTLLLLVLPVIIVLTVPSEYMTGSLIAYVNCVLIAITTIYMLKKDLFLGTLPALAFPFLMFAWSASSLYFAIFGIESGYRLYRSAEVIPLLRGYVRVQLAVLLFLVSYLPTLLLFFNKCPRQTTFKVPQRPRTFVTVISLLCIGIMSLFVLNYFHKGFGGTGLGGDGIISISWWAFGLMNYCIGLMIIVGAFFRYMPKFFKIILPCFMGCYIVTLIFTGMRENSLRPLFFFALGYLFMVNTHSTKKLILMFFAICLFAVLMLGGSALRADGRGWQHRDVFQRKDLLFQTESYSSTQNPFTSTIRRLFKNGGHRIITTTPDKIPYLDFNLLKYGGEMITSLLPGFLYFRPYYRGYHHLLRYDMNVVNSSIPVSHIGHYWMLGGWIAVFLGGLATASVQGVILWIVARARQVNPAKGFIYLSIFALVCFNIFRFDFFSLWQNLFWFWAMAAILWFLVSRLIGETKNTRIP